jgi:hypothetical protein
MTLVLNIAVIKHARDGALPGREYVTEAELHHYERLEAQRVVGYAESMLVVFACSQCGHTGPITAAALPRLAVCSGCGARSLMPGMRGIKPNPSHGARGSHDNVSQPPEPPQPTAQMIADGWAAYDAYDMKVKQPRPDQSQRATGKRRRMSKSGKLLLRPRVMA